MAKPKSKRARVNFKTNEFDILEKVFSKNQYPDVQILNNLSSDLKLPVEKICTWFQNRRSKSRKEAKIKRQGVNQDDIKHSQQQIMFQPQDNRIHQLINQNVNFGHFPMYNADDRVQSPIFTHNQGYQTSMPMKHYSQLNYYMNQKTMGCTPPLHKPQRIAVFQEPRNDAVQDPRKELFDRERRFTRPLPSETRTASFNRSEPLSAVNSSTYVSSTSDSCTPHTSSSTSNKHCLESCSYKRPRKRPANSETDTNSELYSSPELYDHSSRSKEPKLSSPIDDIKSLSSDADYSKNVVDSFDPLIKCDILRDSTTQKDFSDIVNQVFNMNSSSESSSKDHEECVSSSTPEFIEFDPNTYKDNDVNINIFSESGPNCQGDASLVPSSLKTQSHQSFKDLLTDNNLFGDNLNTDSSSLSSNYSKYSTYNFDELY